MSNPVGLTPNRTYSVHFMTRDIGYGVEEGYFTGLLLPGCDSWGKVAFRTEDVTFYLFSDEIISAKPVRTFEEAKSRNETFAAFFDALQANLNHEAGSFSDVQKYAAALLDRGDRNAA